jgi:hypothetical protein
MISTAQLLMASFYDHVDENKTVFEEHTIPETVITTGDKSLARP